MQVSYAPLYLENYTCLKEEAYWPFNAVISVLTDLLAVLLPTYLVWCLQISKQKKVILYSIFGLGLLYSAEHIRLLRSYNAN